VHDGDAGTDDQPATDRGGKPCNIGRKRGTGRRDHNCNEQRNEGQVHPVPHDYARIIGQHRNEVRRPNSEPAGGTASAEPQHARASRYRRGALDQGHRHIAGKEADEGGKNDQPQIVLHGEAGENAKHGKSGRVNFGATLDRNAEK
jgi:hypothetical protein